jgi:general nucleoside transport system ATP-binding protein
MTVPLVRLRGVTKRFGELVAVDAVDLEVCPGEVVGLLGENGAGKSTLMKVLYGFHSMDSGTIEIHGHAAAIASPAAAMAHGIGMVFQQFTLLPALSVLENLLLAWPAAGFWRRRAEDRGVLGHLRELAPDLDPLRPVRDLAVGHRQLVELAKVLNLDARLVILDEPTSVLTPAEAARLHRLVRAMAGAGRAVVIITHKLADVRACADRVVVMRRGRVTHEAAVDAADEQSLVEAMMGERRQESGDRTRVARPAAAVPRLVLQGLSTAGAEAVKDIDLTVHQGEILGVAGVAGNGQWALAETVAGLVPPESGSILLDGESIARPGSRGGFASPVAYIPEQPVVNGVIGHLDLGLNLELRKLGRLPWLNAGSRRNSETAARLKDFDVRPPEPARRAETLSGGNLQKLVAARELAGAPRAVVACYPTMGLDLAATRAVLNALFAHAERGAAILWISEELDDLLAFAHRIVVLHGGRIAGIVEAATIDMQHIGRLLAGVGSQPTTGDPATVGAVAA